MLYVPLFKYACEAGNQPVDVMLSPQVQVMDTIEHPDPGVTTPLTLTEDPLITGAESDIIGGLQAPDPLLEYAVEFGLFVSRKLIFLMPAKFASGDKRDSD
jgi:hypothetical protein